MHLIAWLPENSDDMKVSRKLFEKNIAAPALSEYTIKFKVKPGLMLGYTAFDKKKLREGVKKLAEVLNNI